VLNREKILTILASYKKSKGEKYKIEEIGLFGSFARDDAGRDSDVDIYVKLSKSNLILLSKIRIELQELLDKHVDIVEIRPRMNRYLKKHIEEEAVSAS
jgi:predicted nucleotidyltransferase